MNTIIETMNNKELLKRVETYISNKLKETKPKDLEGEVDCYMGSYGVCTPQSFLENDFIVKWVDENNLLETLQEHYMDWHDFESSELATKDEELLEIEDEDERWNTAHEWTDSDGWVYLGFQNLIYEYTEMAIEHIQKHIVNEWVIKSTDNEKLRELRDYELDTYNYISNKEEDICYEIETDFNKDGLQYTYSYSDTSDALEEELQPNTKRYEDFIKYKPSFQMEVA